LKLKRSNRFNFSILIGVVALFLVGSIDTQAQNTKGDKPANNQRSIFRLPKLKSRSKGGDRPHVGDISGRRRIRTRNSSSAQRAIRTPSLPFANRRPSGDRPGKPLQTSTRIRPSTAKASRNNVYPNKGPYINNPSRKPHDPQRSRFANQPRKRIRSRTADASRNNVFPSTGPYVNNPSRKPHDPQGSSRGGQGGFANFLSRAVRLPFRGNGAPSASGNFITRGRKNVYWGKFSKGERPYTKDITGRPLRAKNYHTPFLGIIPTKDPYRGKKQTGDRAVAGGRFPFSRKAERPWLGNVSGNRIRFSRPRSSQTPGGAEYSNNSSISGKGIFNRRLPGSGLKRSRRSKLFSNPIEGKAPGIGGSAFERFLGKFKGRRPELGGGSVSGNNRNNKGRPVQGKAPASGRGMGGFSGNIKAKGPIKGGGSVSGRIFNNNGQPIQGRGPRFGFDVGAYRGSQRRGPKTFSEDGLNFSGSIRAQRPIRGGGSISGRALNNKGQPIQGRLPKFGVDIGAYRGNVKGQRQAKGGGSVSGKIFNNKGQPIQGRLPKFGVDIGAYRGSMRGRRPMKGGGSVSGKIFNNNGQPIQGRLPKFGFDVGAYRGNIRRGPKTFGDDGLDFSGSIKARRPLKGGGSVSGRMLNNGGNPVQVREPKFTVDVGAYQGNYRRGPKTFSTVGADYTGSIKARKPEHGGGSISGKLWNNKNSPIQGKPIGSVDKGGSRYSGDIRLSRFKKNYVQNPNAAKLSSKKQRPDKTTFAVDGLQIKSKEFAHGKNKSNAKAAIDVRTAASGTVKASEYRGKMTLLWSHKHNPKSSKMAMDVRYPGKAIARLKDYQGNQRMSKPHGKNLHPDAQFAHSNRDNVKHERTILMSVKLAWSKLFRKGANQPSSVKEKIRKPRYDKKEKELWKDLYD
jgi:hypothetical protein